jgi:putative heme-binding domain-containing protein
MNLTTATYPLRWLAVSVLLPLAAFFATAGVMSIPPDTRGIDIVAGRDLFRAHCGSCHFAKAGFPAHLGPNLHEIGRTGAQRKPNLSAAEYILESILDPGAFVAPSSRPGMPRNVVAELPPDDIRNIVGFLASCGAHPDYEEIEKLPIPDRRTDRSEHTVVRLEDMELAEQVMRDKAGCLKCHSLHHVPESKVYSPGIFGVGLTDKQLLREAVVDPHKEIKPNFHSTSIELQSGEVVTGRLLSRSDEELEVVLTDETGQLVTRRIPIDQVERDGEELLIEPSPVSIMPTGFDKLLTPAELQAVLTLIHQLN